MADRRVVTLVSPSQLVKLLDDASDAPVVFERDGVLFHLIRQSTDTERQTDSEDAAHDANHESEPLESVLERIRQRNEEARKGGVAFEDSTELIRRSRMERTAQLLRASGSLTRDDPLWWEVAQYTIDDLLRVRQAVYGDKAPSEDSTELLRRERELRSNEADS